MADHVIGFVTGGISRGIAISSELVAGKKGKESAQQRQAFGASQKRRDSNIDDKQDDPTEFEWALQEVEDELGDPPSYQETDQQPTTFVNDFSNELSSGQQRLPQAVLIPQRRPGSRKRGFMRAYAPVLGSHAGIDQDMFIKFLDDFDKGMQASPIFDVINLACLGIGMVPSTICMAVSVSVGTVNSVAQELQIRYRGNKFLDAKNEEIFKPRGLYAMVMTWAPDKAEELVMTADVSDPTTKAVVKDSSTTSSAKKLLRSLRTSSGTTTESQLPECAPLIHPALDVALTSTSLTKESSIMQRNSSVVNDYLDRRSQDLFASKNPDSKLTAAMPVSSPDSYVNRFANPDHPVNNGSIFALLSGGTFDPIGAGRVRRAEAKAKRKGEEPLTDRERHDALMGRKVRGRVTGTPSKELPLIGKVLKKDVLYLVVVNLPTDEEIAAAAEKLKAAKEA